LRAAADLDEAAKWIADNNRSAAKRLRRAVIALAERLAEYPLSGAARPELADERCRFVPLRGFPFIVIYDAARSPPLILRILHGARDLPEILRDL
jgi:toxin ParE1/3/4